MFARLMPSEGRFFELFVEHAEQILQASRELVSLMAAFDDVQRRCYNIETIEKRGDRIAHAAIELLHKTFITPIDREQIHGLINAMDDIVDLLQDSTETMSLYDLKHMNEDVLRLGESSAKCCERVQHAVTLLPRLSHAETAEAALKTCAEIATLESDADRVMRSAMSRLFREEPDVRELIKLKAIYEHLESIPDRCDDVANMIEGVLLENS